jgi:hypothetical protein
MGLLKEFLERLKAKREANEQAELRAIVDGAYEMAQSEWSRREEEAKKVFGQLQCGRISVQNAFRRCVELRSKTLLESVLPLCTTTHLEAFADQISGFESIVQFWPETLINPMLLQVYNYSVQVGNDERHPIRRRKVHHAVWQACLARIDSVIPYDPSLLGDTVAEPWRKWWWEFRIQRLNKTRAKKVCPICGGSDELGRWIFFSCEISAGYQIFCLSCNARTDYFLVMHFSPNFSR